MDFMYHMERQGMIASILALAELVERLAATCDEDTRKEAAFLRDQIYARWGEEIREAVAKHGERVAAGQDEDLDG